MRSAIRAARSVGIFLILAGVGLALDGFVGAGSAVFVAAVILAGLPRRHVGLAGVIALALTPLAVLVQGLPDDNEVSALFVTDAMIAHHFVFVGFALLASWVVMDVRASLGETITELPSDPEDPMPKPLALAVIGVVAALAVVASVAVVRV